VRDDITPAPPSTPKSAPAPLYYRSDDQKRTPIRDDPPLRVSNGAEVDVRCVDGNAVVVNDDLVWPYADDLVSVIGFAAKEESRDSVITVWKDNIV
jgi:hypothetical protein